MEVPDDGVFRIETGLNGLFIAQASYPPSRQESFLFHVSRLLVNAFCFLSMYSGDNSNCELISL